METRIKRQPQTTMKAGASDSSARICTRPLWASLCLFLVSTATRTSGFMPSVAKNHRRRAFFTSSQSRTVSRISSELHAVTPPERQKQQQETAENTEHEPLLPALSDNDETNADDKGLSRGFYDVVEPEDAMVMIDDDSMLDHETSSEEEEEADDENYFFRDEADRLEEREDRMYVDEYGVKRKVETCILVGVEDVGAKRRKEASGDDDAEVYFTLDESMTEMRELIKTAGLELVGEITQRLQQVNPKTFIGTGKVMDANQLLEKHNCCTIVFDAELTPGQQKALENAFNKKILQDDFLVQEGEIKVIDRTALILDIFAQHAKTREGKLQVDLALHEYRKPRLTRMWTHLERQSGAGGVGLRGPGELQLEIDKRLLRDRIITLKQKIDDVQKQRNMHRRGRERMGLPILSLVGYTNSGKSSLLNYLTRSGVLAESMLFATLDPTTRKVKLPGLKTHPEVLLTDTVGFIQKLPTHLVAAFRATLEEVKQADVLVHVIDVSNPTWKKQERAVKSVLADIGCADKPVVRVLNKIDLLDNEDAEYLRYEAAMTDLTVAVSALHGDGMEDFVAVVEEAMTELLVPIEVIIPYSKGEELNSVHEQGNVQVLDYRTSGTYVRALVPNAIANRLAQYSVVDTESEPVQVEEKKGNDDDEIDWVALGRGRHSQRVDGE